MSSRPKIYLVDGSVGVTGALVCAANVARALKHSYGVILVVPSGAEIPSEYRSCFKRVIRLPIIPLSRRIGGIVLYLPSLLLVTLALRFFMIRDKSKILLINDFYLMHGALARLFGYRGRLITWVRIRPMSFGKTLSSTWLCCVRKSSDAVVAVSKYIASLVADSVDAKVLYDALDSLPQERLTYEPSQRIVFVGNYISGKGQDVAIEAFAQCAAEFPSATLVFHGDHLRLGKNVEFKDSLSRRVRALGLDQRIEIRGPTLSSIKEYEGAHIAMNLSESESFSMTVLEASGCGVPVIATRSGGPSEIVVDGETGILVDVNDVEGIAAAIRRLLSDSALVVKMGKAGQFRIRNLFSMERFAREIEELMSDTYAQAQRRLKG